MPKSNDEHSKSPRSRGSLPASRASVDTDNDLSLDTRLAAQAILNDETIGRVETNVQPVTEPPAVVDWLQTRRIALTVASVVISVLITIVPLVVESSQRQTALDLKTAIAAQARRIGTELGHEKMATLVEQRNMKALKDFYVKIRPSIASQLTEQGFSIKEKQLRIRLDDIDKTLILGVQIGNSDSGLQLIWESAKGSESGRTTPPAGLSNVIKEDQAVLYSVLIAEVAFLLLVWMVPSIYLRRRQISSASNE